MRTLIFGAFILISPFVLAQPERSKFIAKVFEICPNADITEYEAKTDYIEVEFLCDDRVYEVGFDQNLKQLFTETEADIPPIVEGIIHKKILKKYHGWIVDESALVTAADTSYYRYELIKDGIEQNVYFSLEGKNFKPAGMVSNEPWTADLILQNRWNHEANYAFLNPDKTYDLPDIMREISGISIVNDSIIYGVQDELGIVFEFNLKQEKIASIIRFADIGDFEDVFVTEQTIVVLRSDGALFMLPKSEFIGKVSPLFFPIDCINTEGLTRDISTGKLWIACKEPPLTGASNERLVYAVDPTHKSPKLELVMTINTDEVLAKVQENLTGNNINDAYIQFNPSAIAIHPTNKSVYVLSASSRLLAVYKQNKLSSVFMLPANLYYKPEGLSFDQDGGLYISNEGPKDGSIPGQILKFNTIEK